MSDAQLNVDFKFNTQESKKQTAEIRKDVEAVNDAAQSSNKPLVEREGILERIKKRMAELRVEAEKSTSFVGIEKANIEIQAFEKEINRLTKIGRQGFDDMGNAIPDFSKPTGKIERLTYAANLYKKAITEATNADAITKYNVKLEQTEQQISRLKNTGKSGFDELGNKIVVAEKNTKTFVGTLSTGVERLRRLAYIIPGLGIAGILSLALGPLMKWISSVGEATEAQKLFNSAKQETASSIAKEVAETNLLIDRINSNNTSQQRKQALLDEFIAKNPNVLSALTLQNIATYEGKQAIDQYIESLKEKIRLQALEKAYLESVQKSADLRSGALSEKTDFKWYNTTARVLGDMLTFRRTYEGTQADIKKINEERREDAGKTQDVVSEALLKEIEAERKGQATIAEIQDTSLRSMESQLISVKTRLRNLQKGESAKDLLSEKADLEKQIEQRQKLLGLETGTKASEKEIKEMERSASAAQTMQQKIYDLKAEYTRKSMDKDEEELQAVRDKFIKIAEEAERFNKNPKNKIKVSTTGLDEIRDQAIIDLKYKQETEKLKISLSEQKKLYEDYEEYKTFLGKEKANERYKGLIDIEKSHLENLRAELVKIPVDDPTGAQSSRKEELEKQIREEESMQLKKFNNLLKANLSYQDEYLLAIEQFEADKKKLADEGRLAEVEVLTKKHEDNLLLLTENHVKQLDAYKKLFSDIESMSKMQAKAVLANAREMLANTDMPEELYMKILTLINQAEKALRDDVYNHVGQIGAAFDEMASNVGGLNEGLSNSLHILGDMLHAASTVGTAVGDIKTGIASYSQTKADTGGGALGTIAGVAGIAGPIGSAIGAIGNLAKGIVGVFKAGKESRIQAEKELAAFDAQKYNAEFEINAMYRERLRTQNEINKSTLDGLKETDKLLKAQANEVAADQSKLLRTLQDEQYVAGKKTEKYGGFLGIGKKTRTVDIMGSLAGKSYEQIEQLFISNQLTDRAKELFQQLEKIKKEGVDVDGLLAENTKDIWAKATGTTSESITDSIIKGFENGYRSAEDFADDFKGMMNQATREIFRDFVQNKEMEAFYERYANMAKDGSLNDAQRAELKDIYDAMIGRINDKYEDLKGITGDDFLASTDQKGKSSGGIKGITESTAGRIESEMGGMRLAQLQTNELQRKNIENYLASFERSLAVYRKIEEHTRDTAEHTSRLESIEKALISMDKKMSNYDALIRGGGF